MIQTHAPKPVDRFSLQDVEPATKIRLDLVVDVLPDGQPLALATVIASGQRPGNVLLVTGGVHGDEYEGPVAIQDLFAELDPASLTGTFIGIPILNPPAFVAGTREGGLDHQNLARIFPGTATGTISERIAYAFANYLLPEANLYVDLHAGGLDYHIKRFAGYQLRNAELNDVQKAAAIAFGLDFVWGTTAKPGRTLSSAADRGVPAIYVELSGEGRCHPADVRLAKQGLHNVLAYLGMQSGEFPSQPPEHCLESHGEEAGHLQIDHPSPTSGLFVPSVHVWDAVQKGQSLGQVRHPNGSVLADVPSDRSGRVLFLRTLPRVFAGQCLAYVVEVPG